MARILRVCAKSDYYHSKSNSMIREGRKYIKRNEGHGILVVSAVLEGCWNCIARGSELEKWKVVVREWNAWNLESEGVTVTRSFQVWIWPWEWAGEVRWRILEEKRLRNQELRVLGEFSIGIFKSPRNITATWSAEPRTAQDGVPKENSYGIKSLKGNHGTVYLIEDHWWSSNPYHNLRKYSLSTVLFTV